MRSFLRLLAILIATTALAVAAPPSEKTAPAAGVADAAAQAPPEGTAWRTLVTDRFAEKTGLKVDLTLDGAFSANNTSDSSQHGAGGTANFPNGTPADTGASLSSMWVFIHRDIKTNVIPRVTPLPGPVPTKVDLGFEADLAYGRDCQPGRMAGWDAHWGVNEPGATTPSLAASNRQNFLCTPNIYAQAYLPIWKGIAITGGRYGDGLGWEIPPNPLNGPNYFYSHTYSMYSDGYQVLGVLASVNLMRSTRNGYLLAEFGMNNGEQTAVSPSGNTMGWYEGALRWKSANMATGIAYAFRAGDGNVKTNASGTPIDKTDFGTAYTVLSPKGQLRQRHSLVVTHRFNGRWDAEAEGVYFKQAGDKQASTVWELGGPNYGGSHAAGINGRLIYTVNPRISTGVRLETFNSPDGFFLLPLTLYTVNGAPKVSKGRFNDLTLGVNYKPVKYIRIRPELRYDWNNDGAYGTGTSAVQRGTAAPRKSQVSWNMDLLIYF